MKDIPFSKPNIIQKDIELVSKVIESGWLIHGKYSKLLEDLFCEYTGVKYATTVSNCTAGLHLSCLAAGFSANDEVIVPAQTHVATAHAVEYTGAKPIFADVDPITGNIQPESIISNLSKKTKGVIPVHMAGYPCDMRAIQKICKDYDLILIEDCAHAIGTFFNSKHAGSFGIAGCFSFYPTKQITTGEGGIIVSNDRKFINEIKTLKAFGIDIPPDQRKTPGIYDVKQLGFNYRMTDFQAALGVGQMKRYQKNLDSRKKNATFYNSFLKNNQNIIFSKYKDECSYFLFQIFIRGKIKRDKVILSLMKKNIGVSIHYATPVPLMSYYKTKYGYEKGSFENAETYSGTNISLPVHPKLSMNDIKHISKTIKNIIKSEK